MSKRARCSCPLKTLPTSMSVSTRALKGTLRIFLPPPGSIVEGMRHKRESVKRSFQKVSDNWHFLVYPLLFSQNVREKRFKINWYYVKHRRACKLQPWFISQKVPIFFHSRVSPSLRVRMPSEGNCSISLIPTIPP